ncbi:MAG TPA: GNAT family N-acetyltransferase [bacterium]|nr:GNAT family N-acetyltransferase [bacterium]
MTPAELLARFDAEMRIDPPAPSEPGVRYERVGSVVRAIGAWNAVVFARLTPDDADAVIADQVAFFRSLAGGVVPGADAGAIEWKVYGHDLPADLGARLAAAGFEPDEPETLAVFDLGTELREGPDTGAAGPEEVEIRQVGDEAAFADFIAAGAAAFGRDVNEQKTRIGRELKAWLSDPALALYVAYARGRAVASARAEFPPGRSFAGLWGGGTIAEYRGRGIYRALVQARAREARRRGYRFLRVDARETSRPILERLGFLALTTVIEWRLPLPPAARPA